MLNLPNAETVYIALAVVILFYGFLTFRNFKDTEPAKRKNLAKYYIWLFAFCMVVFIGIKLSPLPGMIVHNFAVPIENTEQENNYDLQELLNEATDNQTD